MNRLAVITDSGTATGFRMAGAETFEVKSSQELNSKVLDLIKSDSYGLIAVNDRLAGDLGEEVARALRNKALPVVLPFPVPQEGRIQSGEEYLAKLVKDAIGFYVKLK